MEIIPTALDGVVEIRPPRHGDDRGWFSETYKRHTLRDAGINIEFVQDNESFSAPTGTLRGLHYQLAPHAQDKLVRVIHGSILDVAVDIRRGTRPPSASTSPSPSPPPTATNSSCPPGSPTASARSSPTSASPTRSAPCTPPTANAPSAGTTPTSPSTGGSPPDGPTLSGKDADRPSPRRPARPLLSRADHRHRSLTGITPTTSAGS